MNDFRYIVKNQHSGVEAGFNRSCDVVTYLKARKLGICELSVVMRGTVHYSSHRFVQLAEEGKISDK